MDRVETLAKAKKSIFTLLYSNVKPKRVILIAKTTDPPPPLHFSANNHKTEERRRMSHMRQKSNKTAERGLETNGFES